MEEKWQQFWKSGLIEDYLSYKKTELNNNLECNVEKAKCNESDNKGFSN